MSEKELPYFVATLLLKELPESRRNIETCENILHQVMVVLKGITLEI